ncbi:Mitochondrial acidic protein mam33 [Leucoagaricus gongylophorus]
MLTVRAIHQLSASLVTRRTLRTAATAVPRIAGMRVCSLASKNVAFRTFASSARRFGEGSADVALSQKLQEELSYENETGGTSSDVPQFLKDFQAQNVWTVSTLFHVSCVLSFLSMTLPTEFRCGQISDVAGQDEVTLSRKFGNEEIRLIFSIADLQPTEDGYAPEEGGEEDDAAIYPIRVSLTITKNNGPGALSIDTIVQDGTFVVEHISFYEDGKLGTELTPDADWKRRGLYMGPSFDTLDVALQDGFDSFLKERGINDTVAHFVPQFAEHKEQKEYVKWLNKVKSFVDL